MSACMVSVGKGDGEKVMKHFMQIGQFCKLKIMNRTILHFDEQNLEAF